VDVEVAATLPTRLETVHEMLPARRGRVPGGPAVAVDGSDGGERVWDLPATAPTAGRVAARLDRREALAAIHDGLGASTAARSATRHAFRM
jgi:hypothetical protein